MAAAAMLAACSLALVGTAKPAGATFPGENGKKAFAAEISEGPAVLAVDPAGGEPVNLTNSPPDDDAMYVQTSEGIDYSPDGEKIAFVRGRDYRDTEVWVMDADGSDQVQLTNTEGYNTGPAWFPDGRWLAISSNRGGGNADIYILTLNEARDDVVGVRRLTTDRKYDMEPAVSPSGKRIAFRRPMASSDEIVTLNPNTREGRDNQAVRLTKNEVWEFAPEWSPNGKWLVFERWRYGNGVVRSAGIYSMRSDGSGGWTELGDATSFAPDFSPDGKQIAYSDWVDDAGGNIWRMKSNGTHRVQVTSHADSSLGWWREASSLSWQPLPEATPGTNE